VNELGDGGESMQGITEAQAAWQARMTETPRSGNTVLVTHRPNLSLPKLTAIVDTRVLHSE